MGVPNSKKLVVDPGTGKIVPGQYVEHLAVQAPQSTDHKEGKRDWYCRYCRDEVWGRKFSYCTSCMMLKGWIVEWGGYAREATPDDEQWLRQNYATRYNQLAKERKTKKEEQDAWRKQWD